MRITLTSLIAAAAVFAFAGSALAQVGCAFGTKTAGSPTQTASADQTTVPQTPKPQGSSD